MQPQESEASRTTERDVEFSNLTDSGEHEVENVAASTHSPPPTPLERDMYDGHTPTDERLGEENMYGIGFSGISDDGLGTGAADDVEAPNRLNARQPAAAAASPNFSVAIDESSSAENQIASDLTSTKLKVPCMFLATSAQRKRRLIEVLTGSVVVPHTTTGTTCSCWYYRYLF